MGKYILEGIKDFQTDHIFDCGQCFRWTREDDGSYTGIAGGKIVNIKAETAADCGHRELGGENFRGGHSTDGGIRLTIDNCTEEEYSQFWRNYLDMDRDYSTIKETLSQRDQVMNRAADYGWGIRILRQDFWEAMVSFIISQNNNIPRIKGCIEKLCAMYGEQAGSYKGKDYYNIPTAEVMAGLTEDDLAEVRLGYRAGYLIETSKQILEKGGPEAAEQELKQLTSGDEVLEKLREYKGVGPKVANCIALFGLGRLDAFPVDVWMRRVMNRLYGIDEKDVKAMSQYAEEHFGKDGGIAQQYLFYYIRGLGE